MALKTAVACVVVVAASAGSAYDVFMGRITPRQQSVLNTIPQLKTAVARALKADVGTLRKLTDASMTTTIPQACKDACSGAAAYETQANSDMQTWQTKHADALNQEPAMDANTDIAKMMSDKAKQLEPAFKEQFTMHMDLMCTHKTAFTCMSTTAACSETMESMDDHSDHGHDHGRRLTDNSSPSMETTEKNMECLCNKCPASKDKFAESQAKLFTATMNAIGTVMGGMMSGLEQAMNSAETSGATSSNSAEEAAAALGDAMSGVSGPSEADQAQAQAQLEQDMLAAMCPLVGMTKCFDAHSKFCSHMLHDAMGEGNHTRRLTAHAAEVAQIESQCQAAGIATAPPAEAKVSTQLTLAGLSYDAVMADETVKNEVIKSVIRQFKAKMPGYTNEDFNVTLESGSVKANVEIQPIPGTTSNSVASDVTSVKETVASAVATEVKAMPKVQDGSVLAEGATADSVTATATAPTTAPTPAPPTAPTTAPGSDTSGTGPQAAMGVTMTLAFALGVSVAA